MMSELVHNLYKTAVKLRSRAMLLIGTWIAVPILYLAVLLAVFVSVYRAASEFSRGAVPASVLASSFVDATVTPLACSLLLSVALFYVTLKFMKTGVEYTQALRRVTSITEGRGAESAPGLTGYGGKILWAYRGYDAVFKATLVASILVTVVLGLVRRRLVESLERLLPGTQPPGPLGATLNIGMTTNFSPLVWLVILVGLVGLILAVPRIFYGKTFFDEFCREIGSARPTGLYYALVEALGVVLLFFKFWLLRILMLAILILFLVDIYGLAEDAVRRAEIAGKELEGSD